MARKIDLRKLKASSQHDINWALERLETAKALKVDYMMLRWMSAMTAVELHGVWERYAEARAVAALNHDASHFIAEEGIAGVSQVSFGLASFVVRGGSKFFDFRSMADLFGKADRWLGKTNNPFRKVPQADVPYIDALAAIRNCVVHNSDAAKLAYRRHLQQVYSIRYAPLPDEFLNAKDSRPASPKRYHSRLAGLAVVLDRAIAHT
ncbi:hypothetical protein QRQ56_36185 [Bradyrhizobium sp. U531]|uniref:hypothetical protein n=1 Tax=Bradyrhizobium sp. U531 TaxID=3053458 RepID=UPI003F43AA6A